jgi:aspartyl-tRNA(Asn)/glutamyl-tRNA(Gln) amidotransferase subunit A
VLGVPAPDLRLLALSASDMAARVRRRDLSPVELVEASLAAIEALDPALNAFCAVTAGQARATAREREREAAEGRTRGPLHGVPIGVKDLLLTKGVRTGRGSLAYRHFVPDEDSPAVERCAAAGAIMVGKTTTPEFGWKGTATSPLTGVTRNPWDPAKTPGGSSSGSAVAVSARMVPLALGTDGGGSVRIPAAFCGTFALKASLGRVPHYPASITDMLSHSGPMSRTVLDSALCLDVLKGPDRRDHTSLPPEPVSYAEAIGRPLPPLRCAFAPTLFGVAVDRAVERAVRSGVAAFARQTGLPVEEVRPDWDDPARAFETIWVAGRRAASGALLEGGAPFEPGYANLVRAAARYTATDVFEAMQARAAFCRQVQAFFEGYDVLFLPTIPVPPFEAERDYPEGMPTEGTDIAWARWTPFTPPFNLTGQPAASIPCGRDDAGMPVGLQVVGRRWEDATVLQVCAALERALPWGDPVPPLAAERLGLAGGRP